MNNGDIIKTLLNTTIEAMSSIAEAAIDDISEIGAFYEESGIKNNASLIILTLRKILRELKELSEGKDV